MSRPFPVEGEQVTRDDGSVYLWVGGAWHWAAQGPTHAERLHADRLHRKARYRLHRDLLAWLAALDEAPPVRTHGLEPSDPLTSWTELVLRATLTDSIAEVTDGRRLGLEAHTEQIVSGLLGAVRHQALRIALVRHRLRAAPAVAHAQAAYFTPDE